MPLLGIQYCGPSLLTWGTSVESGSASVFPVLHAVLPIAERQGDTPVTCRLPPGCALPAVLLSFQIVNTAGS
jgi:hypothetical protein